MKPLKTIFNRKVITAILLIIISTVTLVIGFDFLIGSYQPIRISITAMGQTGQTHEEQNATEVWITSINLDGKQFALSKIPVTLDWENRDNNLISFQNQPSTLSFELPGAKEIEINFLSHPWSGEVLVETPRESQRIDLYQFDNVNKTATLILTGEKRQLSGMNIVILIGCFLLLLEGFRISFLLFLSNDYRRLKFRDFFCKIHYMIKNTPLVKLFFFVLINFIITFSFVGHSIFLPLEKEVISVVDLLKLIFFNIIFLTFNLVIVSQINEIRTKVLNGLDILYLICRKIEMYLSYMYFIFIYVALYSVSNQYINKIYSALCSFFLMTGLWFIRRCLVKLEGNYFLKCFVITMFLTVPMIIIYNPGCLTPDTFDQLQQISTNVYYDHHPVMHTLFEKLILSFSGNEVISIAIVQIVFFAFVNSKCAVYLFQRSKNKALMYIYTVTTAMFPATLINLITLWKDIMFSLSFLWLVVLLAEVNDDMKGFVKNKFKMLQLFTALFIVATFRHNGLLVLVGICLLLAIVSQIKQIYKFTLFVVVSLLIIISSKEIIYNKLEVRPNGNIISVVPMHGIAYLYYMNVQVPYEVNEYMERVLPSSYYKDLYNPYSANPYMFSDEAKQFRALDKFRSVNLKECILMYIKSLRKSPYLLIKDRLYGTDLLWNVRSGVGAYNSIYATEIGENDFGIKRTPNYFLEKANSIFAYTEKMDFVFRRSGIYLDILLLSVLVAIMKKRNILLVASPIILNVISLFLSMAWQDFRYVWFLPLTVPFIFFYTITYKDCETVTKDE